MPALQALSAPNCFAYNFAAARGIECRLRRPHPHRQKWGEQPGELPYTPDRIQVYSPVYSNVEGRVSARYVRSYLEAGEAAAGQPMGPAERAVLDARRGREAIEMLRVATCGGTGTVRRPAREHSDCQCDVASAKLALARTWDGPRHWAE